MSWRIIQLTPTKTSTFVHRYYTIITRHLRRREILHRQISGPSTSWRIIELTPNKTFTFVHRWVTFTRTFRTSPYRNNYQHNKWSSSRSQSSLAPLGTHGLKKQKEGCSKNSVTNNSNQIHKTRHKSTKLVQITADLSGQPLKISSKTMNDRCHTTETIREGNQTRTTKQGPLTNGTSTHQMDSIIYTKQSQSNTDLW